MKIIYPSLTPETLFTISQPLAAEKLRNWVNCLENPDQEIIGMGSGEQGLSPQLMLAHVERGTPLGMQLANTWLTLAMDHIGATMFSPSPQQQSTL